MKKQCNCISADMGYHRDDCFVFDVYGKEKQNIKIVTNDFVTVSFLEQIQSQNRLNRPPQEKQVIFVDYFQRLGDIPISETELSGLKKIQSRLKDILKSI